MIKLCNASNNFEHETVCGVYFIILDMSTFQIWIFREFWISDFHITESAFTLI